jgi:hypothetical protein
MPLDVAGAQRCDLMVVVGYAFPQPLTRVTIVI